MCSLCFLWAAQGASGIQSVNTMLKMSSLDYCGFINSSRWESCHSRRTHMRPCPIVTFAWPLGLCVGVRLRCESVTINAHCCAVSKRKHFQFKTSLKHTLSARCSRLKVLGWHYQNDKLKSGSREKKATKGKKEKKRQPKKGRVHKRGDAKKGSRSACACQPSNGSSGGKILTNVKLIRSRSEHAASALNRQALSSNCVFQKCWEIQPRLENPPEWTAVHKSWAEKQSFFTGDTLETRRRIKQCPHQTCA